MNYAEGSGKGQTDDDTSDSQTMHTLIWHLRWNSNAFRGSWKFTHHISRTDKVFDWKRPQRKEADRYTTFPCFLVMKIYRWCSRWRWTSTAFWCCSPNPAATGPMAASAASSFKEGWVWALVPWTAATLSPSRLAPSTMHSGRSRPPTPIGRPCRGWMRLLTGT